MQTPYGSIEPVGILFPSRIRDVDSKEKAAWTGTKQGVKGSRSSRLAQVAPQSEPDHDAKHLGLGRLDINQINLMVTAVEHRFGRVNHLPLTIEWLSDNGSCYIAGDTRSFARDIGLEPRTTPIESPQSNGMAEAFVRTIKRDYVRVSPRPDAPTVMRQLSSWFNHYNEVHPHKALGYRSPREFIAARGYP